MGDEGEEWMDVIEVVRGGMMVSTVSYQSDSCTRVEHGVTGSVRKKMTWEFGVMEEEIRGREGRLGYGLRRVNHGAIYCEHSSVRRPKQRARCYYCVQAMVTMQGVGEGSTTRRGGEQVVGVVAARGQRRRG